MVIRRRSLLEQNVYHVYLDVIQPTELELDSFEKYGEPIVNIGGSFGVYDIPYFYRKIFTQSPHHFFSDTEAKSRAWQDEMEVRIYQAIATYVARPDRYVEEYLLKGLPTRVFSIESAAIHNPNASSTDLYAIEAQSENMTMGMPSGTPVQGQKLMIRIKDNGTPRNIIWNAIYRPIGMVLPLITTISKTIYIGFIYNSVDNKWDCLAFGQER